MLIILLMVNPYLFGSIGGANSGILVLTIVLFSIMIPSVAVIVMRALGFMDSLEMKDKQERIGPYIITGLSYLWIYQNLLHNSTVPEAFKIFVLGATIGLFLAFFTNLFSKVSMHTVGMGGLLGMILITLLRFSFPDFNIWGIQVSMITLLLIVIVACGIVGTARLILNAHHPGEIYGGYLIGCSAQFLAFLFMGQPI